MRAALILLATILISGPVPAADLARARQVVQTIYDIGLYTAELDRIMTEAATRGVYGGPGSTPASRAKDRMLTRVTMLGQRDAVLAAATGKVAARASDAQLQDLMRMADPSNPPASAGQVDVTVAIVKSSFEDAVWEQLGRTARGNTEFPCTKDQRSRCN